MIKPIVVVSKCLGFAKCRYDGSIIHDAFIEKLQKHVKFIKVCPEVEIGLGIPRDPIEIFLKNNKRHLVQPKTGKDLTQKMNNFSEKFLNKLKEVDGFILKYKSPSCGINSCPLYQGKKAATRGNGFFADNVLKKFPDKAIEHEKRLTNFKIREHFLTKLFMLAKFRKVNNIKKLSEFHTNNRMLLMAYNQKELRNLGHIVANKKSIKEYKKCLLLALTKAPRFTSNINVLMHAYNHFSKKISLKEKNFFHKLVKEYREAKIPLSAINILIQDWIIRFDDKYLAKQTFFEPYPEDLIEITDSGKGR